MDSCISLGESVHVLPYNCIELRTETNKPNFTGSPLCRCPSSTAVRTSPCPDNCSSASAPGTPVLRPPRFERPSFQRRSPSPQFRFSCHSPCGHHRQRVSDCTLPRNQPQALTRTSSTSEMFACTCHPLSAALMAVQIASEGRPSLRPARILMQHTLVFVLRQALAHASRIVDARSEKGRSSTRWISRELKRTHRGVQHAVTGTQSGSTSVQTGRIRGRMGGRDGMGTSGRRLCTPSCVGSWR
jgi:hypothetical protein